MAVWLLRAVLAAMRNAWPTRLTRFAGAPLSRLSPLIRVPGAKPSHEQKWAGDGKRDKFAPTSAATVRAVSAPTVGIAVKSTPSIRCSRGRRARSRLLRVA